MPRSAWSALIAGALLMSLWRPANATDPPPAFEGRRLFTSYCQLCHGLGGKGDGPLAGGLRSAPPDLTLIAQNNGGEYPAEDVARIIDGRDPLAGHGGPDMPVWGDAFKNAGSDDEEIVRKIESLVDFLKRLQKK